MKQTSNVQFPEMRAEIMRAVAILADPEMQKRVWLEPIPRERMDDVIHSLYDDAPGLFENPNSQIGAYLRNEVEAKSITGLFDALEIVFGEVGTDSPDAAYLASVHWHDVVNAARKAAQAMSS